MRVTSDMEPRAVKWRTMGNRHYAIHPKGKCRASRTITADRRCVPNNVGLMRRHSSHLSGHRPIERDSHKTVEFSARKSCVRKRMVRPDSYGPLRLQPLTCKGEVAHEADGTTVGRGSQPRPNLSSPECPTRGLPQGGKPADKLDRRVTVIRRPASEGEADQRKQTAWDRQL